MQWAAYNKTKITTLLSICSKKSNKFDFSELNNNQVSKMDSTALTVEILPHSDPILLNS